MSTEPATDAGPTQPGWAVEAVRGRIDEALEAFLASRRAEMTVLDPAAADLVDELSRLIAAGGKRLRPAFCYWGHRAAGGADGEPVIRAAAALELLHTFALVHDDVMDDADERRGVPTTQIEFAKRSGAAADPVRLGRSVAVLVGDLGAVMAEWMLRGSGFPPDRLTAAFERFDRMRLEMAAGQYLDLEGTARDVASAEHVAELKTGSYTVEGPLLIGAVLAGARPEVEAALVAFGRPAGEAFQLRDDLVDREASPGVTPVRVNELVGRAALALDDPALDPEGVRALRSLVGLLRMAEA